MADIVKISHKGLGSKGLLPVLDMASPLHFSKIQIKAILMKYAIAVGLAVLDCRPLLFSRVGTKDTRRVESIPAIITTTQPRVFRRSCMERKRGGGRGQLATLSVSDRGGREAKRRRKFSCIVEN